MSVLTMSIPRGNIRATIKFHPGRNERFCITLWTDEQGGTRRPGGELRDAKMKEFKSVKPQFAQRTPSSAEAVMQTDAPIRKAAGRLSREDQRRLGDILQRVYDDVIQQGVPDRFKDLLNELDGAGDTEQAERTTASPH